MVQSTVESTTNFKKGACAGGGRGRNPTPCLKYGNATHQPGATNQALF